VNTYARLLERVIRETIRASITMRPADRPRDAVRLLDAESIALVMSEVSSYSAAAKALRVNRATLREHATAYGITSPGLAVRSGVRQRRPKVERPRQELTPETVRAALVMDPTTAGAARWLGVPRSTLRVWRKLNSL